MKTLREAVASKGVDVSSDESTQNQILSDDILASLDTVGGGSDLVAEGPQIFGRIFGRIPF